MPTPIRIVVAVPDRLHRQALHCLLDINTFLTVAAVAGNHDDVTRTVEDTRPDVLVIDDRLAGCGIIPRIRHLMSRGFAKIVCLTSSINPDYIRQLMFLGVGACVSRNADARALYTAILRVQRGETYVSADLRLALPSNSHRRQLNGAGGSSIGPVN